MNEGMTTERYYPHHLRSSTAGMKGYGHRSDAEFEDEGVFAE